MSTFEKIQELVIKVNPHLVETAVTKPASFLHDLGFNDIVDTNLLFLMVEQEYNIPISPEEQDNISTVAQLVELVEVRPKLVLIQKILDEKVGLSKKLIKKVTPETYIHRKREQDPEGFYLGLNKMDRSILLVGCSDAFGIPELGDKGLNDFKQIKEIISYVTPN